MAAPLLKKLRRWFVSPIPVMWDRALPVLRLLLKNLEIALADLLAEVEGQASVLGRDDAGNVVLLRGGLVFGSEGQGITVQASGAGARAGTAVLVAGTVTVNTTAVTANSLILTSGQTTGGAYGEITISAKVAGTSFTILSNNAGDTRTIGWFIVESA